MQRRLIKTGKAVVAQPAQIAVKERPADRGMPYFKHRYAVDAHAKGKPPDIRRGSTPLALSTFGGCTMPEPRNFEPILVAPRQTLEWCRLSQGCIWVFEPPLERAPLETGTLVNAPENGAFSPFPCPKKGR